MDFSEFCSRLLERTDIVKLISRYVPLRRMGSSYKACCPFHSERTPSFSVDPSKQLYHCFGCGKGGNAITFLADIESIDRIDAIRMLADEANMELPEFSGKRAPHMDKQHRQRLYDLLRTPRGTTTKTFARRLRGRLVNTSRSASSRPTS